MATTKQQDDGFRLAGYTYGRPTLARIPDPIFPYELEQIVSLFSNDTVAAILRSVGEDPETNELSTNEGFPYLFAAKVLETVAGSGYTQDGRNLSIVNTNVGGLGATYESSEEYKLNLQDRIRRLRSEGNRLSTLGVPEVRQSFTRPEIYQFFKSNVSADQGGVITFDDTEETVEFGTDVVIEDAQVQAEQISDVTAKTIDMRAGLPPESFNATTQSSQGGIYVTDRLERFSALRGLNSSLWLSSDEDVTITTNIWYVRLPKGTNPVTYAVDVVQLVQPGNTAGATYTTFLSAWQYLGVSGDWDYYRRQSDFPFARSKVTLAVSDDFSFPGSTTFSGNLTQFAVYDQASAVLKAGTNVTLTPNGREGTITISTSGASDFDFDSLKAAIRPGDNLRIVSDEVNERLQISALAQNGRWISLGSINFLATDALSVVKTFDTNIPAAATDQDRNIIKIFLSNSSTLDTQNAEEIELIVGLLQTANNANATRTISSSRSPRTQDIRIWKTTYRPRGATSDFVRINIVRMRANSGNQFFYGYLTFAPEEVVSTGSTTDGTVEVGGLTTVSTDGSLVGNGTTTNRLGVKNPFTTADKTKLDNLNANALAALQLSRQLSVKTDDLQAGASSTGWARSVTTANGIAIQNNVAFTLAQARNAVYSTNPASPANKFIVVRLPLATSSSQARIQIESGDTPPLVYEEQVSSLHVLGTDSTYRYYYSRVALGDHVAKAILQVTGSAAHVGTSIFRGIFQGTLGDDVVTTDSIKDAAVTFGKIGINSIAGGAIRNNAITGAKISNDTITDDKFVDAVVARLLPRVLGTAGQILTVNSAANGTEWAAGGGTSSGGGGGWSLASPGQTTLAVANQDYTFTIGESAKLIMFIGQFKRTGTTRRFTYTPMIIWRDFYQPGNTTNRANFKMEDSTGSSRFISFVFDSTDKTKLLCRVSSSHIGFDLVVHYQ